MEPDEPCVPVRTQSLELPVEAHDAWPLQEEAAQAAAGDDDLLELAAEVVAECNQKRREVAAEASERHERQWKETEELTITGEEVAAQRHVSDNVDHMQQFCEHQEQVAKLQAIVADIKCYAIEQAEQQCIRDEKSIRQHKQMENMERLHMEEEELRLEEEEIEHIQKAEEVRLRQVSAEKERKQREEEEVRAPEKADIMQTAAEDGRTLEEEKEMKERQHVQCQRRPFLEYCQQQDDELEKENSFSINKKEQRDMRERAATAKADAEKRVELEEERRVRARAFSREERTDQDLWKQGKERQEAPKGTKQQAVAAVKLDDDCDESTEGASPPAVPALPAASVAVEPVEEAAKASAEPVQAAAKPSAQPMERAAKPSAKPVEEAAKPSAQVVTKAASPAGVPSLPAVAATAEPVEEASKPLAQVAEEAEQPMQMRSGEHPHTPQLRSLEQLAQQWQPPKQQKSQQQPQQQHSPEGDGPAQGRKQRLEQPGGTRSTGAAGRRRSADRDRSWPHHVRSSKEEQRGRRRSATRKAELHDKQRKKDRVERRRATREGEFDAKAKKKDTAERTRRRYERAPRFETGKRRMVHQGTQNSPRAVKRARSDVAEDAHLHMGGVCDGHSAGCCGGQPSFVVHTPSEQGACSGGWCASLSGDEISGSMGKAIPSLMDDSIDAMTALPETADWSPLASHASSSYGRSEESPPPETRVWLPPAAISSRPQFPREDKNLQAEDNVPENLRPENWCSARIWLEEMEWRMQTPSGSLSQVACRWGWAYMPLRAQALVSRAARDISMAARVHKGATVAVVIPRGVALPTEAELKRHSLQHSAGVRCWAALTDGSVLGVLQLTAQEGAYRGRKFLHGWHSVLQEADVGWANHGQAKALFHTQIQILKLLGSRMPAGKQAELRNAPRTECHEIPSQVLPGARMWPLHDPLVSRVFWLNISLERCRSFKNCLRLDRGPRFLDLARLHYGEEVAFLFAWHSHYIYVLAAFIAVTVPLIVSRTYQGKGHIDHWMLPHSLLTIIFGVAVTELWQPKVKRFVHRWHAHGDCTARWQQLVLHLMASRAAHSPPRALKSDPRKRGGSEQTSPGTSESRTPRRICIDHCASTEGTPEVPEEGGAEGSMGPGAEGRVAGEDSQCTVQFNVPMYPSGVAPHEEEEDVPRTNAQTGICLTKTMDTLGFPIPQNSSKWRLFGPSVSHKDVKRILKSTLIFPIVLLEWVVILVFFSFIAWFEIWVIFDWGGCREYNVQFDDDDWRCLSADQLRGFSGVLMGALPSIAEGVFFELLLAISKVTAHVVIKMYHFRTREQYDFAAVTVIFLLEVIGKVGFILVLGLGFVPVWSSQNWTSCRGNWDYFVMGDWSLGCLKGQIPFQVRLKLFESIMKGPMWIAGIASISAKTLVPLVLKHWRRLLQGPTADEDGCGCGCRRHLLARFLLAPMDFALRVAMLFLQTDSGAVGGLRFLWRWPPALAKSQQSEDPTRKDFTDQYDGYSSMGAEVSSHKQGYTEKITKAKRARLWSVLLEGERREHEPFNEYIELLLHFLWTSCFAIVWPLGCIFSLLIQILEIRFDCVKLLAVRRRCFPRTRHMSVAWVPHFARIVCHISILVNVALLLLSYRQLLVWLPDSCEHTDDGDGSFLTACERVQIMAVFLSTWACFLLVHFLAQRTVCWLATRPGRCCVRRTANHSRISKAEMKSPESQSFSQVSPTLCVLRRP